MLYCYPPIRLLLLVGTPAPVLVLPSQQCFSRAPWPWVSRYSAPCRAACHRARATRTPAGTCKHPRSRRPRKADKSWQRSITTRTSSPHLPTHRCAGPRVSFSVSPRLARYTWTWSLARLVWSRKHAPWPIQRPPGSSRTPPQLLLRPDSLDQDGEVTAEPRASRYAVRQAAIMNQGQRPATHQGRLAESCTGSLGREHRCVAAMFDHAGNHCQVPVPPQQGTVTELQKPKTQTGGSHGLRSTVVLVSHARPTACLFFFPSRKYLPDPTEERLCTVGTWVGVMSAIGSRRASRRRPREFLILLVIFFVRLEACPCGGACTNRAVSQLSGVRVRVHAHTRSILTSEMYTYAGYACKWLQATYSMSDDQSISRSVGRSVDHIQWRGTGRGQWQWLCRCQKAGAGLESCLPVLPAVTVSEESLVHGTVREVVEESWRRVRGSHGRGGRFVAE